MNASACFDSFLSTLTSQGAQLYYLFVAFCCSLVRFCSDAYFYALCALGFFGGFTFTYIAFYDKAAADPFFIDTAKQLSWALVIVNLLPYVGPNFYSLCDRGRSKLFTAFEGQEPMIELTASIVLVVCTGILINNHSGWIFCESMGASDSLDSIMSTLTSEGAQLYYLFVACCYSLVRFCSDAYFYHFCALAFLVYTCAFIAFESADSFFINTKQLFWALVVMNLLPNLGENIHSLYNRGQPKQLIFASAGQELMAQFAAGIVILVCAGILINNHSDWICGSLNASDCIGSFISTLTSEGAQLYYLFVAFCCSLVRFCSDAYFYPFCTLAFFVYTCAFIAYQVAGSFFMDTKPLFWALVTVHLSPYMVEKIHLLCNREQTTSGQDKMTVVYPSLLLLLVLLLPLLTQ